MLFSGGGHGGGGYGHIAPKTNMGKVVTIVYAIPGVPLMMLCLANIGDGMAHSFRFLYWRICCYACTKRPKKKKRIARSTRSSRRYPSQSGSSIRTRASSFRRSNRASEKSADSHLSDSAFYTSSYTDADYNGRMEEDMGVEDDLRGLPSHRASERSQSHFTGRSSQFSKSSDYLSPPPKEDEGRVAVLFNKYALENDGAPAEDTNRGSLNGEHRDRDGGPGSSRRSRRDEEDLPDTHQTRPHRLSHNRGYSDSPPPHPRSMQRPGNPRYHHHHHQQQQQQQRGHLPPPSSSRLSRMDDDYYYDDYDDYGYEEDEEDNLEERPVPIMLAVILVLAYILGGATLFANWEGWMFLDSVYFCFITLTTIGFGDLVPAQRDKDNVEVRIGLCSIYLLFGIALLAMSFNLVQEEVISRVKTVAKMLGIIKVEEEEEEDVE
ncbi:hypothetical protein Pcinc_002981 [Petrolisthes cinctipes]|uniref:Potassium channel domain-containing protein n=1 Tax=Petrolisthes cinctipes TaxID=88211 RepID=A0AAE1GPD2_PETCI|nr:hypothetical protein Pcinc_002981 [Petrolisthes cinctipes]